ncbi:MAG: 4Fe-4S dicluster domain-containing protein [Deltaproteobacteria bacterium]|jgi:ferredoxin-type protein NapG|nr:4Fe-4S dicluster domain-containing protein [Deltaproteobacteria bacterium]
MTDKNNKTLMNRRRFIKTSTAIIVGGTTLAGLGATPLLRSQTVLLRPPGALEEDRFLASCIKCGQCLQVCPPQVIQLANITQGFAVGTPYITARDGGCILCAGLPCVLACPTGSLNHDLSEGKDAQMGLAVISQPDTCLSVRGKNDIPHRINQLINGQTDTTNSRHVITDMFSRLTSSEKETVINRFSLTDLKADTVNALVRKLENEDLIWLKHFAKSAEFSMVSCRICFTECPIKSEKTILFQEKTDPESEQTAIWPVIQKSCVGCGVCEERCPTAEASITIIPRKKWMEVQG